MKSTLNPYISFDGNAREAMEFYNSVFKGKLEVSTFGESGMTGHDADPNKIMHSSIVAENGINLMAADLPPGYRAYKPGTNISISLSGDNDEELTGYYNQLSEGGKIEEPLKTAPWGDKFGMFTDKFGIFWMVNIAGKKSD